MGLNYRKRVNIMPGVKLNFSKRGVSTTIGGKGASVNIGKRGVYRNVGIPGTGIHSRQKISGGKRGSKASPQGCMVALAFFAVIITCFTIIL